MKHDMDGPADTRMMGIVHEALRRDLRRLHEALTTAPYPDRERRAALGAHAAWMMSFLHHHHGTEDSGLYPLVRAKNPAAAELLDVMDADHKRVVPAMARLEDCARRWASSGTDADRIDTIAAIDELQTVLVPHLDREENEMMPVVARSITQRDWHAWDQANNIKPKKLTQLAEEGNWLIDGLDPERRKIVEAEVPLVPRYVVLYGFGPGYRKRAAKRWGS